METIKKIVADTASKLGINLDPMIILGVLLGIILIVIVTIVIIRLNIKKKNAIALIDEIEENLASTKSLPISYRMSKVKMLNKNEEYTEMIEKWELKSQELFHKDFQELTERIRSAEDLVYTKKFKKALLEISQLENDVKEFQAKCMDLLHELEKETDFQDQIRAEITTLKEVYRKLRVQYQKSMVTLEPYNERIEVFMNEIEDEFNKFELSLQTFTHQEANDHLAALTSLLQQYKKILEELPHYVAAVQRLIPQKIKRIYEMYLDMKEQHYLLYHLELEEKFNTISTQEEIARNQVADLNFAKAESAMHLIGQALEVIEDQLVSEKNARSLLKDLRFTVNHRVEKLQKLVARTIVEAQEIREIYGLDDNELRNLDTQAHIVQTFVDQNEKLADKVELLAEPYTILVQEYQLLSTSLNEVESTFTQNFTRIQELRADEKHAQKQITSFKLVVIETKAMVRKADLPVIAESYYDHQREIEYAINNLELLLKQSPIDIEYINAEMVQARELVFKLYESVRNIVQTANLAERVIIFANKYRSTYVQIETALTKSEILFREGHYTKSLESALNAIEWIYPGARHELILKQDVKSTPNS